MEIKTTMRAHPTPVRMTIIKEPANRIINAREGVGNRQPSHTVEVGMQTAAVTKENSMEVP